MKLGKSESEVLLQYVKLPDLEKKVDTRVAIKCLSEIKAQEMTPAILDTWIRDIQKAGLKL